MIAGRILVRKLIRLSKCSREENYPNTIGYLRFYRVFFIWMMMCLVRNYPAIRVVQKIKTSNYEFEIHICDDSSLADTIVQINGTKICEINYYSAIINTFDPAYDKLKRKKTIRCFMELMESFYNEQKKCRAEICLATIFSTQALFTPVKTLFLLHFMMQTQDISFLKFVFTFASFVFELPSGYFLIKSETKFVWYVLDFNDYVVACLLYVPILLGICCS